MYKFTLLLAHLIDKNLSLYSYNFLAYYFYTCKQINLNDTEVYYKVMLHHKQDEAGQNTDFKEEVNQELVEGT